MKALDRKLWRDLVQMRGQVLTIALVVACAVAGFVGTLSTYVSLDRAREDFYREARFADVFASLKRAPKDFASRLADIPGVVDVQTGVVFDATLDIVGVAEPLVARMVGIEPNDERRVNRLYLRRGRMIDVSHPNETIVSEAFAATRGLIPGSEVSVLLNGRRKTLTIVGIVVAGIAVVLAWEPAGKGVAQVVLSPDSASDAVKPWVTFVVYQPVVPLGRVTGVGSPGSNGSGCS